jgi:recombination protein RecR
MYTFPVSLQKLIFELQKLPGVGPKSAQRLAYALLKPPRDETRRLAAAMGEAADRIRSCSVCFNLTETDPCAVCADPERDRSVLCVVESVTDLMAMERTGHFKGKYHVLEGSLSPLEGRGPEDIRVPELLKRLKTGGVREIILALNPDVEGEATALYLSREIKPTGIRLSRLAYGLPAGGNIEYADDVTILRAMEGRREV